MPSIGTARPDKIPINRLEELARADTKIDQESMLWMAKLQHGMCVEEIETFDQLVDVLKMETM